MTKNGHRGRPPHPGLLTPTEWRVTEGVRHGLTNREIAERRSTSVDAVKFHVSNILSKLGFASREELKLWDGIEEGSTMAGEEYQHEISKIDAIGQIARTVGNLQKSENWYRDVLELDYAFSAGGMAFFDCSGLRLMLTEGSVGTESILYFSCPDIHRQRDRLASAGVKILSAPHRIHTHADGTEEWMCFFEDPDGRPLALMSSRERNNEGEKT